VHLKLYCISNLDSVDKASTVCVLFVFIECINLHCCYIDVELVGLKSFLICLIYFYVNSGTASLYIYIYIYIYIADVPFNIKKTNQSRHVIVAVYYYYFILLRQVSAR